MEDPCCCPCNHLQSSPPPHTCVFQKQKRVDEEGEHELNQHHCENQAAPLDARLGADDHHRKYVLCLDVGTTGLRAYLYDDKTSDISRGGSYRQLPSLYPQPGWVEQDPWVIWAKCKEVMLEVMDKASLSSHHVAAIGITTQRSSFVLWNKETGVPVCNFISWQDVRTSTLCEEWNASFSFKGLHAMSKVVHLVTRNSRFLMGSIFRFSPLHCTPRLLWALNNIEAAKVLVKENKLLFGTMDTWILWNLTGGKIHATDYSNISATGLYDTFNLSWNKLLFDMVDLSCTNILPEVRPTSGDFGSTAPELFGGPIPIRALVADQQAALFGECCFDVGDCKVTIGTGCFVDINTGSKALVSPHGLLPMIAWAIGKEITYMIEGVMSNIGTVINWGANEMEFYKEPKDTEAIAASVPDTKGVYFVPAFTGLSAPHQDPTARGTLLGLTTSTKKQHIVRAMLESVGYTCNELLETVGQDLPSLRVSDHVKVDGGVSQNNFVNQFIADMTRKQIVRSENPDQMTALGAAFLAGLGAGLWKSKEELKQLRANCKIYEPQMKRAEAQEKYVDWKRAVERSLKWAQDSDNNK